MGIVVYARHLSIAPPRSRRVILPNTDALAFSPTLSNPTTQPYIYNLKQ
jgi:hypothetical protein